MLNYPLSALGHRRIFLFVWGYVFPLLGIAQPVIGTYLPPDDKEKSILTCSTRKPGLYKTFAEFKANAPSETEGYVVEEGYTELLGSIYKFYHLTPSTESKFSKKDLRRQFWGFCYRDTIYFNLLAVHPKLRNDLGYINFEYLGRYCFCKSLGYSNKVATINALSGIIGGVAGGIVGAIAADAIANSLVKKDKSIMLGGVILNINNGEFYTVDKSLMRILLQKDSELLAEFNSLRDNLSEPEINALHKRLIRAFVMTHSADAKL